METRVLPFESIDNFRDYGGYAVAGGGHLREGFLYRSAQHRDATPRDLAAVGSLGLSVVIDLRGARERQAAPCPRAHGFKARIVKADAETAGLAPHLEAARDVNDPAQARAAMLAGYAGMPFRPVLIDVLRGYFAALAEDGGASLVHCMAGKDRTGFAVALVHAMLGVHHDDLIADYLLTNTAGRAEERIEAGARVMRKIYGAHLGDEAVRILMLVEPAYLDAAFAAINAEHGSLQNYLNDRLGVDAACRRAIASRLVV
jgi:protein tyrosine/serine phosphatase